MLYRRPEWVSVRGYSPGARGMKAYNLILPTIWIMLRPVSTVRFARYQMNIRGEEHRQN
jgi:hypothetical protein